MIFDVTEHEANLIVQALAELPAKLSMNLIIKLQRQYKEIDHEKNADAIFTADDSA